MPRTREDTVRTIVSSLTDESCVELAGELGKYTPIALEDSCLSDEEGDDWQNWQPAPVGNDQGILASDALSNRNFYVSQAYCLSVVL